jgi:hypothetical protein
MSPLLPMQHLLDSVCFRLHGPGDVEIPGHHAGAGRRQLHSSHVFDLRLEIPVLID